VLNPKVLYFQDEAVFRCTELKKGFVRDDLERVPAVRSFLGFVDFENYFCKHVDAFGSF
jgi:hypothetical protein